VLVSAVCIHLETVMMVPAFVVMDTPMLRRAKKVAAAKRVAYDIER